MFTHQVSQEKTLFCGCVKKTNFGAQNAIYMIFSLSFLHKPQKMSFLHKLWWMTIEYSNIYLRFFIQFFFDVLKYI
jgi:hypothetical protein